MPIKDVRYFSAAVMENTEPLTIPFRAALSILLCKIELK
jgi:hypothetical protein